MPRARARPWWRLTRSIRILRATASWALSKLFSKPVSKKSDAPVNGATSCVTLSSTDGDLLPAGPTEPGQDHATCNRLPPLATFCERGHGHGKRSTCRIQRWCDRDHHHHHGPRIENAARRRLGRTSVRASALRQLCVELHLSRHLLEQSPPPPSYRDTGRWPHSLGQFIAAVLAVAHSGRDGLDG